MMPKKYGGCISRQQLLWTSLIIFWLLLLLHYNFQDRILSSSEFSAISVQVQERERKIAHIDSKWIILHAYMRGGSSFLGSIFDHNKDAFYWFEPVLSAYHSMLATYYVEPLQMEVNADQSRERNITEFERKYLKRMITDLLDCNFEELPLQFIMSKFLYNTKSMENYVKCIDLTSTYQIEICAMILWSYCKQNNPALSLEQKCHALMSKIQDNAVTYIDIGNLSTGVAAKLLNIPKINTYQKCTKPLTERHKKCLPKVVDLCHRTKLHVVKVIRSNTDLTMDIYNTHNNSYVIYQVRDPRGILMSRSKYRITVYKLPIEAKRLCTKMLQDYRTFKYLQKHQQKRILIIRYEDVVTDIQKHLQDIYKFIGEPIPGYLRDKIFQSVNAKGFDQMGFFRTQKKNGTKTAYAWKKSISLRQKDIIDTACSDFLKEVGYKI